MDILFINSTHKPSLKAETNGTMILATKLLQAGFSVDILRFYQTKNYLVSYKAFIDEICDIIINKKPKIISFYTLWPYYHLMIRIAKEIKKTNPKIITVFGGPQSSATAQATLEKIQEVDYILTGEGEETIVPFFDSIFKNNARNICDVPGAYFRKDGKVLCNSKNSPLCDLNKVPYWDKRLYTNTGMENYVFGKATKDYFMPIDVGRGCPYSCTFCSTCDFWKRTYRLKSPERILADINYYYENFGIKSFYFSHDAFTVNKKLITEVCDKIIESGIKIFWRCTSRVDCLTEELILKMKQAGMVQIEVGIESGSKRMQRLINKNLNLEKAKEIIKFLLNEKITTAAFFMYGLPDEEEEDLEQTLKLQFDLVDMGIEFASMSYCKFNAQTEITNKYFDKLRLPSEKSIINRGTFGYEEEYETVKQNKDIFVHFYHLDTPVRNKYTFLFYFAAIYQLYPKSIKHLKSLYEGRLLDFYNGFIECNAQYFSKNNVEIDATYREKSLSLLLNFVSKCVEDAHKEQIMGLLEFDSDIKKISENKEDISICKEYAFSYIDYMMNLPIEKYSNCKTKLLIVKNAEKINIKPLEFIS